MASNTTRINKIKKIIKQNWDEIGIAAALGHLAVSDSGRIGPGDAYIIEAIRRSVVVSA